MLDLTDEGYFDQGRLQRAFALGSPVLVLGPGCHRIGYDRQESREWERVRRRMARAWAALPEKAGSAAAPTGEDVRAHRRFLEQLWLSKLSEETRALYAEYLASLDAEEAIEIPGYKLSETYDAEEEPDPARRALALHLLRALVACTRCLGSVIAKGDAPVTEWEHVRVPEDAAEAGAAADMATAASEIKLAAELADALAKRWSGKRGWLPGDAAALAIRGLTEITKADLTRENYLLLKVDAIAASLRDLEKAHFGGAAPLSGAVIEWLSDLLWHVFVSGSGVSPSQDELAFSVNLHVRSRHESPLSFTRPQPGDFRRLAGDRLKIGREIRTLLKTCDSGLLTPEWKLPRQFFVATLAASLVQTWSDEVKRVRRGKKRLVVALVADYDLMFERAVMSILEPGEQFHVVMPIWVGQTEARLDWIIGPFSRPNVDLGDIEESQLTQTDDWTWLREAEPSAVGAVNGPIIVKLNGSPLHGWGTKSPTIEGVGLTPVSKYGDARIEPAAVYSEHDSMQSIISLAATVKKGKLSQELFGNDGLSWHGRSWLFFGHRFSDWLPRLRLFFMANKIGAEELRPFSSLEPHKIAVDRTFGWPEIALLGALGVDALEGNLADISSYADDTDTDAVRGDDDVDKFLTAVRQKRGRVVAHSPSQAQ